jgi:dTDP-glucose pyrophosphorylase
MERMLPLDSDFVSPELTILDAIAIIQKSEFKIALVVDTEKKLIGTVTDGDVRRALLAGNSLGGSVSGAMNKNPVFLYRGEINSRVSRETAGLQHIPVVDDNFKPVAMYEVSRENPIISNEVVLMAGGKGTRLMPHTQFTPKPLVEIDGVPLISALIGKFASQGFKRINISVGHMAKQIMDRIGNGSKLGVEVNYLHELQPLGTAGALGELKSKVSESIVVANADLVTSCDFRSMLNFHESLGGGFTVGMREYSHQVPFGVVDIKNTTIVRLVEKPSIVKQVAAGIYCLSPSIIELIQMGEYLDMPSLASRVINSGNHQVNGFPIHEQWDDVGRPEDLMRLRSQKSDTL